MLGRLTKTQIDEIRRLWSEGYLKSEIASKLGISRSTVLKYTGKESERGLETPGGIPFPCLRSGGEKPFQTTDKLQHRDLSE